MFDEMVGNDEIKCILSQSNQGFVVVEVDNQIRLNNALCNVSEFRKKHQGLFFAETVCINNRSFSRIDGKGVVERAELYTVPLKMRDRQAFLQG